jgi:hypothetical protein
MVYSSLRSSSHLGPKCREEEYALRPGPKRRLGRRATGFLADVRVERRTVMQLSKRMVAGCSLALLALASLGAVDCASAANLLVNPGFETGDLTGWLVFGQTASSSVTVPSGDNGPSAPGTCNAFMDNQATALVLTLEQSTPPSSAIPGQVSYSFDLRLDRADVGGVLFVEIFAKQASGGAIGGSGLLGPYWPWEIWTAYSGSFVAPPNTNFLTIQFMASTGATIGSNSLAHVDNVILDQGTSPTERTSWGSIKAMYQ